MEEEGGTWRKGGVRGIAWGGGSSSLTVMSWGGMQSLERMAPQPPFLSLTLDELHNLSVPGFPHLSNRKEVPTVVRVLPCIIRAVMHLKQYLA